MSKSNGRFPSDQFTFMKITSALDLDGKEKGWHHWLDAKIVFHAHSDYWMVKDFPIMLLSKENTDQEGTFKLSRMQNIVMEDKRVIIVTKNTIYEFEIVGREFR